MQHSSSLIGTKLGDYRVVSELGRGGMGVVYKAEEESLRRVVALKVLAPHLAEDTTYVERFIREARAAAHLIHPNIVTIHAVGEQDGIYFIAMEYVAGRSLADLIQAEAPLSPARALVIIRQAADALAEAHRSGFIHRDIKPQNIMVDDADRVKVMDFGLAKADTGSTQITSDGAMLGTPRYMSPEQCESAPLDGRTDIYSLGVTLFEMLTGRSPFKDAPALATMYQIVSQPLPSVKQFNRKIPGDVARLVAKMTANRRVHRYASAWALCQDLDAWLRAGRVTVSVEPDALDGAAPAGIAKNALRRLRHLPRRVKVGLGLCGVGVLVLVVQSALSQGAVWYVDKSNTSGTEDGRSWETAFTTLQAAIDAAATEGRGEIWVAQGVYDEPRVSMMHDPPRNTGSLVLSPNIYLYGGFAGASASSPETSRNQRDDKVHVAAIDGSRARDGLPAHHVVVGASGATLVGFTIIGGNAADAPGGTLERSGGGLLNVNASPRIVSCTFAANRAAKGGAMANFYANPSVGNVTFTGNWAKSDGGAVYSENASPFFVRCRFTNNTSEVAAGGAVMTWGEDAAGVIDNCAFFNNAAAYSGGAVANFHGAAPSVERCVFTGNTCMDQGGAIGNKVEAAPTIANCLFVANAAPRGGAIDNTERSELRVVNCTFWGNTGTEGAVIHHNGPVGLLTNCILWGNKPGPVLGDVTVTYCDIEGGFPGEGNIGADPAFVLPEGDTPDFHLQAASPCIDAGTMVDAPAYDRDGRPRPQGPANDIGAYEFEIGAANLNVPVGIPEHVSTP